MKTHLLRGAILASLGSMTTPTAQAAALNNGDVLHITSGVATTSDSTVTGFTGSYFGCDCNGDHSFSLAERDPLAEGTTGLVIGVTTSAGASHPGAPVAGDTNAITAPFDFFGNTGSFYLTSPVTGNTTNGLNIGGWTFAWDGLSPPIPLGAGSWQPSNCVELGCTGHVFTDGNALFQWDGVYGHGYTLDYTTATPLGDPSGTGGVPWYLHLEGTVSAVPLPAAVWLLISGIFGLLGTMRQARKELGYSASTSYLITMKP